MDLPHHFKLNRLDKLIIFTRYPELGKAKTRLIPALGDAIATDIHRRLAEHTLEQCREWRTNHSYELIGKISRGIIVCFTGGDSHIMAAWLGADLDYQPQGEGDLGQRIVRALRQLGQPELKQQLIQELAQEFIPQITQQVIPENRLVIIGTDCPELTTFYLNQAFQGLAENDLVLGPAEDGGYYLIGLKQVIPQLFQGISWGTATVFSETVTIAKNLGLNISYLPILRDIDRPEDLAYLATLANFYTFNLGI